MDAFSRLLASIGQSLGRGLGQVGQTELEKRARLEELEAQRKAQIGDRLLQTFTQLLNTQGIQDVDPEGIQALSAAVIDLALGRVDSPNVSRAISVFPRVAESANKLATYRDLATRSPDTLARLIVGASPEEAQKMLRAVGLEGLYESLRARGEVLAEAERLGLRLQSEQIENLVAQRTALLARLEPEIERLRADVNLSNAQAEAIRQRLPLELTRLQLDIQRGTIEVSRLPDILDANLRKTLAEIGLTEEQARLTSERIKTEVAQQLYIGAMTEYTKAQHQALLARLGPEIERLRADIGLTNAQAEALRQKLPLELARLQLDIQRGTIEVSRLPDILDAALRKTLAEIGLTEEQTRLTSERIKTEVAQQLQIAAQTEYTKAQTRESERRAQFIEEQIQTLQTERGLKLASEGAKWLRETLSNLYEAGVEDPKAIKAILTAAGNPYALPEAVADAFAVSVAQRIRQEKMVRELGVAKAVNENIVSVAQIAANAPTPEAAKRLAMLLLPENTRPEVREAIGEMARHLKTLGVGEDLAKTMKGYMAMLPATPEDESRLLRGLYDSIPDKRLANGVVNTIKNHWRIQRALQQLEASEKAAGIDKDKAQAAFYKVQAQLAPREMDLKWEEFSLDKWYKQEQVKLGWSRLELDRLIALAQTAGAGEDSIKALKELAQTAKALDDVAVKILAERLRKGGHVDCAESLGRSGSISWIEAVQEVNRKCNDVVRAILTNTKDHGDVIQAVENAVRFGQVVTEMAAQLANQLSPGRNKAPADTPSPPPGTEPPPERRGAPTGAPPPAPGATPPPPKVTADFRAKGNQLRAFGVEIPNDVRKAGAMAFVFALEGGDASNPFRVMPSSGATPDGPDRGFQAVIAADKTRPKALAIDSAPAFGITWIFPRVAENPDIKIKYIDPKFVKANEPLFERAKYFGDDGIAVAASYLAGALQRSGVQVRYTPAFVALTRTLVENDLHYLRARGTPSVEEMEKRFLNLVKSRYGTQYRKLGFASESQMLEYARDYFRATRLSTIGSVVLGGKR